MLARSAAVLVYLAAAVSLAAPPRRDELPLPLRDWTGWVLHGEEEATCPFLHGQEARECYWPGRLTLALDDKGGRFTQSFRVWKEAWLLLPGDAKVWPQNVQVDGRPAVVVPTQGEAETAGRPAVKLGLGEHSVSGEFAFDSLPEALQIPAETGLLSLAVKGKAIALPNRDESGRVYLQKEASGQETERVELTAHRLITDEIPLTLTTRLRLQVSGKSRELLLGRALPDGFVPMSLSSGLPVRIEPDGRLRLQVRPGSWTVELVARSEGPVNALSRPKADGLWADGDELWVFDARPSLRQVLVEGVNAVEPQQTTLPDEWKRLPAYALSPTDTLRLTERRRGDSDPAPDVLRLTRTLWLDFEGQGYTVSDRVSGQLHRSWRLDMQPRTELGRVVAAGADQSITRLGRDKPAGVELRQGALALEADSRIEGDVGRIPAVSWDADFHSVGTTLQVPPGWRLVHAAGADSVPGTWVQQWTLLDIFLVLIIALAAWRLFGARWGVLALVTLVLTWQEGELVPQYVWLAVLVGEALVRLLPQGWPRSALRLYRLFAWAALVIFSVTFMVTHVRQGMYPALEHQHRRLGGVQSWSEYSTDNALQYSRSADPRVLFGSSADALASEPLAEGNRDDDGKEVVDQVSQGLLMKVPASPPPPPAKAQALAGKRSFNVRDYDKNAMVQTGPGLPRWEWTALAIGYSGPVARAQELRLWFLGPRANFALAFLRVLLLALLVVAVLGFPGGFWPESLKRSLRQPKPEGGPGGSVAARLLALVALLFSTASFAQAAPSPELLKELQVRLKEKPDCAPVCASSPRMLLEATPRTLRLRLEVLAGAQTAVPLPGNAQHWVPETVLLDGRPTAALRRGGNGSLWLVVPEGAHQVVLEGELPSRATVQVELPLRPHRVEAKLDGWTLDGLHEDGLADENLQLSRTSENGRGAAASLQVGTLPPFVRVERNLVLGLTWSVETRVERLTPTGSAVVLEVPLLPGESVTSSDVRVQNARALVNIAPSATEAQWSSVLETKSPIALSAPKGIPWVEVWRLDVSPVWHVQLSGIPVVHQQDASGAKLPEWRPWPGEEVKVEVQRPEGVAGQTLTIDQSQLTVSPGVRATDVTLTANLRSSRGGLHRLVLPEGAVLQSVSINGAQQPIRQEGREVALPLVPGSMSVALAWRQDAGLSSIWRSPEVNVNLPTVNAEVQVEVPRNRWVLFLSGPRMGPAVLFWSFLLVLLLVSLGLGKSPWTPLRARHWILLALGLSQVPVPAIAFVVAWLLFVGWCARKDLSPAWFNLRQLMVAGVTLIALVILAASVYEGLLGRPEMQIQGNGSSATTLRWFQDRTAASGLLPTALVVSVPMLVYRAAMLGWSLWMALSLLRWLRWAWGSFSTFGLWKRLPPKPPRVPLAAPVAPPAKPPAG